MPALKSRIGASRLSDPRSNVHLKALALANGFVGPTLPWSPSQCQSRASLYAALPPNKLRVAASIATV